MFKAVGLKKMANMCGYFQMNEVLHENWTDWTVNEDIYVKSLRQESLCISLFFFTNVMNRDAKQRVKEFRTDTEI